MAHSFKSTILYFPRFHILFTIEVNLVATIKIIFIMFYYMEPQVVNETTTVSQELPGGTTTRTVRSSNNIFSGDFFVSKTNQIIFTIIGIINVLILLRFILLLLGANRTGVVNFILGLTNIFVAPFVGIFPSPSVEGAYVEAASIVAIIMWFIFAWILAVIVGLFSSSTEV